MRAGYVFLLGSVVAVSVDAATYFDGAGPVDAWGRDDTNVVALAPFLALYVTSCPWVAPALANSSSRDNVGWDFADNTKWTFRFAQDAGVANIGANTVVVDAYYPWAVTNDPFKNPAGNAAQLRPVNGQDGGGADFTMI